MTDMNDNMTSNATARRKTGLIATIVALVAVIAVAALAYNMLLGAASPTRSGTTGTSSQTTASTAYLKDYDATVYTADGEPASLTQIADGKPLVMNFWATWCPYCVQEMDDYQQIVDEYGDQVSFAFIDVADGQRETVEDGSSWLKEQGYRLPDFYDTDLSATRTFGATNLPTTVIVTSDGEVKSVKAGAIDPALMRGTLSGLLAE